MTLQLLPPVPGVSEAAGLGQVLRMQVPQVLKRHRSCGSMDHTSRTAGLKHYSSNFRGHPSRLRTMFQYRF